MVGLVAWPQEGAPARWARLWVSGLQGGGLSAQGLGLGAQVSLHSSDPPPPPGPRSPRNSELRHSGNGDSVRVTLARASLSFPFLLSTFLDISQML